jgi:hypothetical protein
LRQYEGAGLVLGDGASGGSIFEKSKQLTGIVLVTFAGLALEA